MAAKPARNMSAEQRARHVQSALQAVERLSAFFDRLAEERAAALLADHRRVRDASQAVGRYAVEPNRPLDVLGVYVLVPLVTF